MNEKQTYKQHKAQLEKQFHVVGHPKADLLYDICKTYINHKDFDELDDIAEAYAVLVELIKK